MSGPSAQPLVVRPTTRTVASHFAAYGPIAPLAPLALTLVAGCATGAAQAPVVSPDRPGYSYTTGTVPVGAVQVEIGYTAAHAAEVTYQSLGEGLVRVGVGSRLEARLFTNSYALRSDGGVRTGGVEDAKVGVKWRPHAARQGTGLAGASVAILAGTSIPTGHARFGVSGWQPEVILAGTLPVTAAFGLTANVGDTWAKLGTARSHRVIGTVAGWYTVSPRLSTFAEYGGSQYADDLASRLHYVDAGFAFVPFPAIQLDLRAGRGINGVTRDDFVGVGFTRRW